MPHPWRFRETLAGPLTPALIEERAAEGWRAEKVDWVREGAPPEAPPSYSVQPPYGLNLPRSGDQLQENEREVEVMYVILEGLVQDSSLSQIAHDLAKRGHTTRSGFKWTPGEVFDLLPRIIEYSPRLFASPAWHERRAEVLRR
jgi:hypothetical protein